MRDDARLTPRTPQTIHKRKHLLTLALVAALGAIVTSGVLMAGRASAVPQQLFPLTNAMTSADSVFVVARFSQHGAAADDAISVAVNPASGGATLTLVNCVVDIGSGNIETPINGVLDASDAACAGALTDVDGAPNIFGLNEATVDGIGGGTGPFRLVLRLQAPTCTNQLYAFTATQNLVTSPVTATINGSESVQCAAVTPTLTPAPTATPLTVLAAVVVTANPNVVLCGGTSLITASVRGPTGHVIPGHGFHFSTDAGLLTVGPPNTADVESAAATLQIFPFMTSATVLVSVGTGIGTIEGQITVQQFCPSPNTTAGGIILSASSNPVACNGRTFIAATLRDVTGNPVPDGTEVNFVASAGSVSAAGGTAGLSPSGTPTASSPSMSATTKGGTLNIVYTADGGASGNVTITAASGASFGSMSLQVCAATAASVRPPNTGEGFTIRPPNTGDGGLAGQ